MPTLQTGQAETLELGDFAPDQDPDTPGIILDAQGCFPTMKGYQAEYSTQPYVAGALPGQPVGSALAQYSDTYTDQTQVWAGTVQHLYRAYSGNGGIWVQADTLGTTSFGATAWRYAQFNDDLIAVGGAGVVPQVATGPTGLFAPLGAIGAPPVGAVTVLSVNGQVMMFQGASWYVSALGTDNDWTPNVQTQAGSGTLYDFPGDIVAAAQLYRNVIVFKQNAMWLGQYVGGFPIWSFVPIADNVGAWSQESVITLPDRIVFLGSDDFYSCTGYTPTRIPNRCKEWFFDVADPAYLGNTLGRYDPYHSLVYWYFVSATAPIAGVPDRYVVWNARVNRWGTGYLNTPSVPVPNTYATLRSGLHFDTNYVLQTRTGTVPELMRIQTGWYGSAERMSQFQGFAPRWNISPTTQALQMWHASNTGSVPMLGPNPVLAPNGWFFGRQTDFYHYFQITASGIQTPVEPNALNSGCELAAVQIMFRQSGVR